MPTSSQALCLINETLPEVNGVPYQIEACHMSMITIQPAHPDDQQLLHLPFLPPRTVTPHTDKRTDIASSQSKPSYATSTDKSSKGFYAFDPITGAFSWQRLQCDNANNGDKSQSSKKSATSPSFDNSKNITDHTLLNEKLPLVRIPDPVVFQERIQNILNLEDRTESIKELSEPTEPNRPKALSQKSSKPLAKERTKSLSKIPIKSVSKESNKSTSKVPYKSLSKESNKSLSKEPYKTLSKESNKSLSKEPKKSLSKESSNGLSKTYRDISKLPTTNKSTETIERPMAKKVAPVATRKASITYMDTRCLVERNLSTPLVTPKPVEAEIMQTRPPRRMDSFVLNYKSASTPTFSKAEEKALFEEVKRRCAKRKKKKYVPTTRMRKELPPPCPNKLCFNYYDCDLTHKDVKRLIESQSESKILDLKFDPVYVQMVESAGQCKSMWIFTIAEMSARTNLLYYGLCINEENVRVRLYDDVMREEHNAYKLYQEMEGEEEVIPSKTEVTKISTTKKTRKPSLSPSSLGNVSTSSVKSQNEVKGSTNGHTGTKKSKSRKIPKIPFGKSSGIMAH